MGYQNGLLVHYWSGDEPCRAFLITDDHAPEYNHVVSGVIIEAGAADGAPAALTTRLDVTRAEHDRGPRETDTVKLTAGTWHVPEECPERFNRENKDQRPPRPRPGRGEPVAGEPARDPVTHRPLPPVR